jgi:P27 family predicted phage terminase small subunit
MPGPPPKPTALKQLAGNPGKRPLNKHEPKPTGTPTCPTHLDSAAKREWTRISRELTKLGLLTNVDRAALAAYCAAYSRWAEAEKQIQKFGLVIKAPSGYPIQNPYVGIANTSLDIMRKFSSEFGLTPASRTRLHVEPTATEQDPFEAFMREIGASEVTTNDTTEDDTVRNESD